MLGGIEAIGETCGGITESGEDGGGVETDKKEGTGTINSLLVETPFKLSPTSIVNFCFLLKYLWRLLGAFFFCCMIN